MNEIASAFEDACLAELQAIKPGNVHIFADGHGMVVEDFVKSAHAVASVIAQPELTVGERIEQAINATWDAVGSNTNLGIVLLAAPLIQSVVSQQSLPQVMQALTVHDAECAFRAIKRANPAGLGEVAIHDVRVIPQCTLLQAMQTAAERDRVAFQYAHDYQDVLNLGVPAYRYALAQWQNPAWATTVTYLTFLAQFADTHVVRKYGLVIASTVQEQANTHLAALRQCANPKSYLGELLRFDNELKLLGINPGSSADLTVATLLIIGLKSLDEFKFFSGSVD
jgi:triphosphoribosyl-dephospho-CoA synthase